MGKKSAPQWTDIKDTISSSKRHARKRTDEHENIDVTDDDMNSVVNCDKNAEEQSKLTFTEKYSQYASEFVKTDVINDDCVDDMDDDIGDVIDDDEVTDDNTDEKGCFEEEYFDTNYLDVLSDDTSKQVDFLSDLEQANIERLSKRFEPEGAMFDLVDKVLDEDFFEMPSLDELKEKIKEDIQLHREKYYGQNNAVNEIVTVCAENDRFVGELAMLVNFAEWERCLPDAARILLYLILSNRLTASVTANMLDTDKVLLYFRDDTFTTLLTYLPAAYEYGTAELSVYQRAKGELLESTEIVDLDTPVQRCTREPITYRMHFFEQRFSTANKKSIPLIETDSNFIFDPFLISTTSKSYAQYGSANMSSQHSVLGRTVKDFTIKSAGKHTQMHTATFSSSITVHSFDEDICYDFGRAYDRMFDRDALRKFLHDFEDRFISVRIDRDNKVHVVATSNPISYSYFDQMFYGDGVIFENIIYRQKLYSLNKRKIGTGENLLYGNMVENDDVPNEYIDSVMPDIYNFYVDKASKMLRFLHPVYIPMLNYSKCNKSTMERVNGFDYEPVGTILHMMYNTYYNGVLKYECASSDFIRHLISRYADVYLVCKVDSCLPLPRYAVMGYSVTRYEEDDSQTHIIYNGVTFSGNVSYDRHYSFGKFETQIALNPAKLGVRYIDALDYISMLPRIADKSVFSHDMDIAHNDAYESSLGESMENVLPQQQMDEAYYKYAHMCKMLDAIRNLWITTTSTHKEKSARTGMFRHCFKDEFNIEFKELYEYVKARVIGHDESLKQACYYVWSYLRSLYYDKTLIKDNYIISGASGCGKTEFMRVLQEFMKEKSINIPVKKIDMAMLTPSGYKGTNLEAALYDIIGTGRNPAIIFLDELDKKLSESVLSARKSYFDEGVQFGLLTALEGSDVKFMVDGQAVTVDTRYTLFIGLGTFEVVRTSKEEARSDIGFTSDAVDYKNAYWNDITIDDVIAAGGKDELVGRFADIVNFRPLDDDSLKKILYKNVADRYLNSGSALTSNVRFSPDVEAQLINLGKGKRGVREMIGKVDKLVNSFLVDVAMKGSDRLSSMTIYDDDTVRLYSKRNKGKASGGNNE